MTERRKRTILISLMVLSLVPMVLAVQLPQVITPKSFALYTAALSGYFGINMLLWNYILGAKTVFGKVFYDLAPVLDIHKFLGKYGTLLIFMHPLLITYSYGESVLYSLIPQIDTEFERHVTLGRIALYILFTVWITSAVLRSKLAFRPWKYLHYLVYIVLPYAFLHVPGVGSQYISQQATRQYYAGLLVVFAVFVVIRLWGLVGVGSSAYRVSRLDSSISNFTQLTLSPLYEHLQPRPGQYVYVRLGFISEAHPFSVTRYEPTTGELTMAFRGNGLFTRDMQSLPVGAKVMVSGPYGSFLKDLNESPTQPVFIAGGIGITPFVTPLLHSDGGQAPWLFYANRTERNAPFIDLLRSNLGKRLVEVYSQPTSTDGVAKRGRITSSLLGRRLGDPTAYTFYICGPAAMLDAVASELRSLGVSERSIHRERFSW